MPKLKSVYMVAMPQANLRVLTASPGPPVLHFREGATRTYQPHLLPRVVPDLTDMAYFTNMEDMFDFQLTTNT